MPLLITILNGLQLSDDDEDEFASTSDDDDYATYRDPYVHTIDAEEDSFVDDVDFYNVDRERGSAYERYKRRILKELEDQEGDEDDDDDSFASADDKWVVESQLILAGFK